MQILKYLSLKRLQLLIVITVIICLNLNFSYSQNPSDDAWFVNKNATGQNNGTNWIDAWESFSDINWSLIQPGDTVYISGGTDSTQYNETLFIGKSGTISNYIVVTKGKSTGHNSRVVIDGGQTRAACISNSSYRYVKIENLKLTNAMTYNIGLSGSAGKMTFNSITSHQPNGTDMGMRLWVVDSITVENSTFTTDSVGGNGTSGEGDCIIMNGGNPNYEGGHIIRYNTFTQNNKDPDNHSDVIQSYWVEGCEMYNNYFIVNNEKTNNSSGLYLNSNSGTWKLYNNVFIARSSVSINGKLSLYEPSGGHDLDTVYIVNNSFYEASYPGIAIKTDLGVNTTDAFIVIKNNAWRSESSSYVLRLWHSESDSVDIDYNIMGVNGGTANRQLNGSTLSFATWQSNGYDVNGSNADAEYTSVTEGSENLIPSDGSNLIDAGVDDPVWFFDDDYTKTTRSANWEVGAYEYQDNLPDSITLKVKILLEGPFNNNIMLSTLQQNNNFPFNQPYNTEPWNYNGNEDISAGLDTSYVDWILIELRNDVNPAEIEVRKAALLNNDGTIIDTNGDSFLSFHNVQEGSYYIAIFHRNHLAVMSANSIQLSENSQLYDFSTGLDKAFGIEPMVELTNGKFGMYAGDGNGNGGITITDRNEIWLPQNGTLGYLNGDFNLDGGVTIHDINLYWNKNNGNMTQVP